MLDRTSKLPIVVLIVGAIAALAAFNAGLYWVLRIDACLYGFAAISTVIVVAMSVDGLMDRVRGWRIEIWRFEVLSYEIREGGRWLTTSFDLLHESERIDVDLRDESWRRQPEWAQGRRAEIERRIEEALDARTYGLKR